jgi:hypothetical protein
MCACPIRWAGCLFLIDSFAWLVIGESVSERRVHEHGRQLQVRLRTRLHRYTRQVVHRYVHLGLGRNEMGWRFLPLRLPLLTAALAPPPSIFPADIDECSSGTPVCVNANCVNFDGGFNCQCFPGYNTTRIKTVCEGESTRH